VLCRCPVLAWQRRLSVCVCLSVCLSVTLLHCVKTTHQRQKYSPATLLSGDINVMRMFVGVPWRGGLKRQWGGPNRHVLVSSAAISSEPLKFKTILLCSIMKCFIGFPSTITCLTLSDLEMPFYAKICCHRRFAQILLHRFRRQLCNNEWRYFHTISNRNVRQGLLFLAMYTKLGIVNTAVHSLNH